MDSLRNTPQIPILVGPTGVGKSEIAYQLALQCGFEILSADAFQVYQGMAIGTAQPSFEYQKRVPHHLVGIRHPLDSWSAVQFAEEASQIIEEAEKKTRRLLIVGGSGFYIRALVKGVPPGRAPSLETRAMVMEKITALGPEKAHQWLTQRDENVAQKINPGDIRRIGRALEKTFETSYEKANYSPLGLDRVVFLGVERSRENLNRRLKERTLVIWDGLLKETECLLGFKLPENHPALAAIGYAEAIAFLNKTMNREMALERIYIRTRQYAKRQWTWFKHQHDVEWLNLDEFATTDQVVEKLKEKIFINHK